MLPELSSFVKPVLWGVALAFTWLWLRKAITPQWVAQLFESEGVPSSRLALAFAVVLYTMFMDASNRLTDTGREAWLTFAGVLLGLGIAKVTASRFAPKPATDLTEKAAEKNKEETDPA